MGFILKLTLLLITGASIAGKTSLINSSCNKTQQKNATTADSSAIKITGVWILSDNEKHENLLPVKKLIISATEFSFYTDDKLVYKTRYSASVDTLIKNPANTFNFHINLVDIYEQWNCQVLIPQNSSLHSRKQTISLFIIPDTSCKCNCPYEVYNLQK
ncbi:MAG: hypothetical protein HYR66_01535 [Sphingobacteriales bacterium]|nr:hypothetical protein [Sphingobacteriales bacterium]MBI3719527.1 hypothetical protein [Sphingobacteriales bacterium]